MQILNNPPLSPKTKSMPASSSCLQFFLSAYFGRNYFNFKGRASRKEWWSAELLKILFLALPIGAIIFLFPKYGDYIELFYELYIIVPTTSLMVRRFHDFNMNPWWGLLIIPLLFLPVFKGDDGPNPYGENIY